VSLKTFLKSLIHALRASLATQILSSGVPAPIVMKIGGWKNNSTMDIYLRLGGVDTKGATKCLGFVPTEIDFGGHVINLFPSG